MNAVQVRKSAGKDLLNHSMTKFPEIHLKKIQHMGKIYR